jgi:hypothetical protein
MPNCQTLASQSVARNQTGPKSALHDEAIACVAVIDVSSRLGVYRVMFESDSSTLVHALKTLTYDLSEIGVLLRDAKSTCTLHFDVF